MADSLFVLSDISPSQVNDYLKQNRCGYLQPILLECFSLLSKQKLQVKEILGLNQLGLTLLVQNQWTNEKYSVRLIFIQDVSEVPICEQLATILKKTRNLYLTRYNSHFYSPKTKCFFYVSEYCKNGSIRAQQTTPSPKEISDNFIKILTAVRTLHKAGLVHGSITPSCILISDGLEPKISSSAVFTARLAQHRNALHSLSLPFTAHEILDGSPSTYNSDAFSIGAVICWLCGIAFEKSVIASFQLKSQPRSIIHAFIEEHKDLESILLSTLELLDIDPTKRTPIDDLLAKLSSVKITLNE